MRNVADNCWRENHEDTFYLQKSFPENCAIRGKGKGKATPLQAWTVREGSRRLMLPDFKTIGT